MKIMCPGPTGIRENVRTEMSKETINPDIDRAFNDFYYELCNKFSEYFHSKNQTIILGAEAILGLEAAAASLTEKGSRVLVIDNGIYGEGFKGFVEMYGGEAVMFKANYHGTLDIAELEAFLKKDSDFAYATVVACDTPSGIRNDLTKICPLLHSYGILSVVDAVSECFVSDIDVDAAKVDVLIAGSQKALSAPAGLTIMCISPEAYERVEKRETPVSGFYANIAVYRNYRENGFPYTMPINLINSMKVAFDNVLADKSQFERHEKIAAAVRKAVQESPFELLLNSSYSNGVTAIKLSPDIDPIKYVDDLRDDYGVQIASSYGVFQKDVIRVGHMGENCYYDDVLYCLQKMDELFKKYNYNTNLSGSFKAAYK